MSKNELIKKLKNIFISVSVNNFDISIYQYIMDNYPENFNIKYCNDLFNQKKMSKYVEELQKGRSYIYSQYTKYLENDLEYFHIDLKDYPLDVKQILMEELVLKWHIIFCIREVIHEPKKKETSINYFRYGGVKYMIDGEPRNPIINTAKVSNSILPKIEETIVTPDLFELLKENMNWKTYEKVYADDLLKLKLRGLWPLSSKKEDSENNVSYRYGRYKHDNQYVIGLTDNFRNKMNVEYMDGTIRYQKIYWLDCE